jgi:hypothetical protein
MMRGLGLLGRASPDEGPTAIPLNLLKMCVGCDGVDDLRQWQQNRALRGEPIAHRTRNMPRRATEILAGGSLYWIIQGQIRVRQRIIGLDPGVDGEGVRFCLIRFDPALVETARTPARPMQGWRYLEAADAPPDLGLGHTDETDQMPPQMLRELRSMGLM